MDIAWFQTPKKHVVKIVTVIPTQIAWRIGVGNVKKSLDDVS